MVEFDEYKAYSEAFASYQAYQKLVDANPNPCCKMLSELEARKTAMNHAWVKYEAKLDGARINERLNRRHWAQLSLRELEITNFVLASV